MTDIKNNQPTNLSEIGFKISAIGDFLVNTTPHEFEDDGHFYWNVGETLYALGKQISEIAEQW